MKKKDTKLVYKDGFVIAAIEIECVHEKYFSISLRFPDGSWRRHFISYNAVTPGAAWGKFLKEFVKGA